MISIKVVRADYEDIFYVKLGLETLEYWQHDPIWKPYYHQVGMLIIEEPSIAGEILENFGKLGIKHNAEVLKTQEIKE